MDKQLGRRTRADPRAEKFEEYLSEPTHNLEPTFVQCNPNYWVPGEDAPCLVVLCNWLDPTTEGFVTGNNIQLVIKAAGASQDRGPKPPSWGYGYNRHTGCQPKVLELPINQHRILCRDWLPVCLAMLDVWQRSKEGIPPAMVAIHCNEGVNRAPGLFAALLAKFHGQKPSTLAMILSDSREIHKMYRHTRANGGQFAVGIARATWANMWAIYDWPPFMIPYRKESERGHQPHRGAVERNPSCFTFVKPAELGQPFWSTKKAKLTAGRSRPPWIVEEEVVNPYLSDEDKIINRWKASKRLADEEVVNPHRSDKNKVVNRFTPSKRPADSSSHLVVLQERFSHPPDDHVDDDDEKDYMNAEDQAVRDDRFIHAYLHDRREWSDKEENACFNGKFFANEQGRFPLHQLAEDLRDTAFTYHWGLWEAIASATLNVTGMTQRTTGKRPPGATYLHMACKQEWQAKGCQPSDQTRAVELLLNMGADPLAKLLRNDTVLMEVAGAGHVNMFNYLCHLTVMRNTRREEFGVMNKDGRNLWSIAGLAIKEERAKDRHWAIQAILEELARENLIDGNGEAARSSADRGRKKIKATHAAQEPPAFPDAGSSN